MALQVKEGLYHPDVPLVDGDVERRLPPLVPRVQVGARVRKQLHDGGLVAEGRVVDGAVAVLVLDLQLGLVADEGADHLQADVLRDDQCLGMLKIQYE